MSTESDKGFRYLCTYLVVFVLIIGGMVYIVVSRSNHKMQMEIDSATKIGKWSRHSGVPVTANPYSNNHQREAWFKGWTGVKTIGIKVETE